ncbi:hypothetical protein GIB67_003716, partial [Kingdonia uniflora]
LFISIQVVHYIYLSFVLKKFPSLLYSFSVGIFQNLYLFLSLEPMTSWSFILCDSYTIAKSLVSHCL